MRKLFSLLAAAVLVVGCTGGAFAESGNQYAGEITRDGWIKVAQADGPTLGCARDSGVRLLRDDGRAFKDLNKNGALDPYEDWRLDAETRAEDLARRMSVEEIAGLMVVCDGLSNNFAGKPDDSQKTALDSHIRCVRSDAASRSVEDQANWNNVMQAYAESTALGIPVQFYADLQNGSPKTGVSPWPDNMALAASFDPFLTREAYGQIAKEYRALGITTLFGPQADLATEPRWGSATGSFGEDPALASDMTAAAVNALQSTYDGEGGDIGWGADSVNAMMKHWPGDGAAQAGRASYDAAGSYTVYPGGAFETSLIPFIDGGLMLDGETGSASAVMTSYSIAWLEDAEYGESVGAGFSEHMIRLLRGYGFDGVICTGRDVVSGKNWGVEDLTRAQRVRRAIGVGVDQFGGEVKTDAILEGIALLMDEMGEEAGTARLRASARRLLLNSFRVGLFENAYLDVEQSKATVANGAATARAFAAQEKTIVMLKNDGAIRENASDDKPVAYIPLVFTPGFAGQTASSAVLPVDRALIEEYFTPVTDTVSDVWTGPADENGRPTLAYKDIIRASAEQLARCDLALVFARTPMSVSGRGVAGGFDIGTQSYIPISLQYGEYTADSDAVPRESIAGRILIKTTETPYGAQTVAYRENQSYYGHTAKADNATDLDMILYAAGNMPEEAKIIVAVNAAGPSSVAQMVVSEFERRADAILYGFNIDNRSFLAIAAGKREPVALLPAGLPKDMIAVESQWEDVPRDMECHVDAAGNTYDFAFGMNWSGVINDERVAKYKVAPLTGPAMQPVQ